jgi:hypothetical protein
MVHFDGFNGACGRLMFALLPVNAERAASVALGQIPMIQTRELGARIMRDQLADNEWTAIKPMLPNAGGRATMCWCGHCRPPNRPLLDIEVAGQI